MKLYFIACGLEGEDYDLFVWAGSVEQAFELHSKHFYGILPLQKRLIFEVPVVPPAEPKALAWHNDIKEILG